MIEGRCSCGLSYAVRRGGNAVGYCALSIRCGTRDEVPDFPGGTAHFVEHTIFKGTARRNAASINSCLDKLGGELNAYTTKEEIVLHATVLKEDLRKAAGLLFELATCPTFPADEVETERGVIIDEINSYRDAPSEEIYDVFEEMLFDGHPLSGQILGKVKSVKKITREELARFVREKFIPRNMAFTVVADIDETVLASRVERLAAHFFPAEPDIFIKNNIPPKADMSGNGNSPAEPDIYPQNEHIPPEAGSRREPFNRTVSRRNHQANCIVGGRAPSLYEHRDRVAMVLLSNILGGPASNSVLNAVLREKRGWVYGVECTYTQYADTGIVSVILGCEKDNLDRCLRTVRRELDRLIAAPISMRRLRAAKRQLLGQIAVSGDNGENQCLSMGKSLMSYGHVFTDEEGRAQIEAVTAEDLQRLAQKFFSKDSLSTLIFV